MLFASDTIDSRYLPVRFIRQFFIFLTSFAMLRSVDFKLVGIPLRLWVAEHLMLPRKTVESSRLQWLIDKSVRPFMRHHQIRAGAHAVVGTHVRTYTHEQTHQAVTTLYPSAILILTCRGRYLFHSVRLSAHVCLLCLIWDCVHQLSTGHKVRSLGLHSDRLHRCHFVRMYKLPRRCFSVHMK